MVKVPQVDSVRQGKACDGAALGAAAWAVKWAAEPTPVCECDGMIVSVASGAAGTLVSVLAPEARLADGEKFRRRAMEVYRLVRDTLEHSPHRHIARMWNHIPGIHDRMDGECDRYMHFNAARFAVMSQWFGGEREFAFSVPAASGIGHDGTEMVVHALATAQPGLPIDNPLQVPAYRYSKKYGPLPPCFARATRVRGAMDALLIAGTAAITGEESRHLHDLAKQFELTLRNLAMLIRTGGAKSATREELLRSIEHVRIYYSKAADAQQVDAMAASSFAGAVETMRADLCRADLLVEIEGVARL